MFRIFSCVEVFACSSSGTSCGTVGSVDSSFVIFESSLAVTFCAVVLFSDMVFSSKAVSV